jgi:hypothetical protein
VLGRELREQRIRIDVHGACQGPDVTARVDISAAGSEVVLLDRLHDGDADPGGVTDIVDGQPSVDTCLSQRTADRGTIVFFEGTLVLREVVLRGVADGHGGAFRACSHLCWRFSLWGVRKGGATGRYDFVRHQNGRTS